MVRFVPSTHYFVESTLLCEQAWPDVVLWRAGLPPLQGSRFVRRTFEHLVLDRVGIAVCDSVTCTYMHRLHALTCTYMHACGSQPLYSTK